MQKRWYEVKRISETPPTWCVVSLEFTPDDDGAVVQEHRTGSVFFLHCLKCDTSPCTHTQAVDEKRQGLLPVDED